LIDNLAEMRDTSPLQVPVYSTITSSLRSGCLHLTKKNA